MDGWSSTEKAWEVIAIGIDSDALVGDGFEPDEIDIINAYEPNSAFIIGHAPLSWPDLRSVIKVLLERYGGFLFEDQEDNLLDINNIDDFQYRIYLETLEWKRNQHPHYGK